MKSVKFHKDLFSIFFLIRIPEIFCNFFRFFPLFKTGGRNVERKTGKFDSSLS